MNDRKKGCGAELGQLKGGRETKNQHGVLPEHQKGIERKTTDGEVK